MAEADRDQKLIDERLTDLENLFRAEIEKDREQIDRRSKVQNLLIGLVTFVLVILMSGFSLKGKIGDADYEYRLSTDDAIKLAIALSSGGLATWAGFTKKN